MSIDPDKTIPLDRHAEIVQSIYRENQYKNQFYAVVTGWQDPETGHRISEERCVWCGVNYLDALSYDPPDAQCPGPTPEQWDHAWWPLDKVDAVLHESRGWRNNSNALASDPKWNDLSNELKRAAEDE
jgi:hypothetical protein